MYVNRPAPAEFPRFCNPQYEVWDVRKPQIRCYDEVLPNFALFDPLQNLGKGWVKYPGVKEIKTTF